MSKVLALYTLAIVLNVAVIPAVIANEGLVQAMHEPVAFSTGLIGITIALLALLSYIKILPTRMVAGLLGLYALGLIPREVMLTLSGTGPTLGGITIALVLTGAALEWSSGSNRSHPTI